MHHVMEITGHSFRPIGLVLFPPSPTPSHYPCYKKGGSQIMVILDGQSVDGQWIGFYCITASQCPWLAGSRQLCSWLVFMGLFVSLTGCTFINTLHLVVSHHMLVCWKTVYKGHMHEHKYINKWNTGHPPNNKTLTF